MWIHGFPTVIFIPALLFRWTSVHEFTEFKVFSTPLVATSDMVLLV